MHYVTNTEGLPSAGMLDIINGSALFIENDRVI